MSRGGAQAIFSFQAPQTAWRPPKMSELPPTWAGCRRIAFDVETFDPDVKTLGIGCRRDGYVVGYSFAIEDGPAFYVPMRHALGGNVEDAGAAWQYLKDRMWEFAGTLLTSGGAYDHDYFLQAGGQFNPNVKFRDCALDEALINEWAGKFDLDSMLARYDLEGKDEEVLAAAAAAYGCHPKKDLWKIPGTLIGAYGLRDVVGPLELSRRQERRIEEQGLWKAVETESKLLPVVVAMRRRGVAVDMDRLDQFERWADRQLEMHFERFRQEAGLRTFGLEAFRSADKMDKIVKTLTGKGLPRTAPSEKRPTGTPSIAAETFAQLKHPAFVHLAEAKSIDTVKKTFVGGERAHIVNGRIHSTFRQIVGEREGANASSQDASEGAAFGRMSSSHTNMQNKPSPEKSPAIGGRWRSIYRPDEGEWGSYDYKQQEPRWGIHWAEYLKLAGAREAGDKLRANPHLDPYMPMVEDTGLPRGQVKVLYLAITYNQGEVATCEKLGVPTVRVQDRHGRWRLRAGPEGRAIIDKFNDRARYISGLRDEATNRARERGEIRLIDRRAVHFLRDPHGNVLDPEVATNRLLQGNAGVQTKLALIELHRQGVPVQTVVHDELNASGRQWEKIIREVMETIVPTSVPMIADVGFGRDYAEASGYGSKKIEGVVHEYRPTSFGADFMESFQWVPVTA